MEDTEVEEMDKELYVAAMKGDVEFLQGGQSNQYYPGKTSEKNNIIHIAIRYEQLKFIEAALEKFPSNYELISEGNSIKNTPLHIAAEVGNFNIVNLLYDHLKKSVGGDKKPWREPNLKGDTPVHVAIIHDNVKIAKFLLNEDPYLARIVNINSKEAPLHLAIKQHVHFSESELLMVKLRQLINEEGADLAIESAPEENMSSMIRFLVEKESCAASWPDANGMTPLHRAASLGTPYNLQITRLIVKHWPQSAEVCDASGKSILHLLIDKKIPSYQEGRNLLNLKEIYALRNHQDQHGNTPLHIAIQNKDTSMMDLLLESSTKNNINNSNGICATSVIQQQDALQMLPQGNMTKDESEATADSANIEYLQHRFSKLGLDLLLSQDSKGRNVLHKLMQFKNEIRVKRVEFLEFTRRILKISPALVCQTDQSGNTPIHILVQNVDTKIYTQQINSDVDTVSSLWDRKLLLELLSICDGQISKLKAKNFIGARYTPPWVVQNADGNTPLHEAVLAKNEKLTFELLMYDQVSAGLVNKRKETTLHLVARSSFENRDTIELMVEANSEAAFMPDEEGLTPIQRAFKVGDIGTATILCVLCPEAAKIYDDNEGTVWHLLIKHPSAYFMFRLLRKGVLIEELKSQDRNGDTPLHSVINGNRFDLLNLFVELDTCNDEERHQLWQRKATGRGRKLSNHKHRWLMDLLEIPNKAGKTPADLIADSPSLPQNLEQIFGSDHRFRGLRSSWGIPRSQLQNYMNSMNIIAALQTTITFTAAFTVPGGLIQDIGTPILIRNITFQIFMISDVIAMCLSMMVLICLLWMVATDKRKSVMIQDFAVSLLLASFVATLLTFMMGVYATIFPVKPWIAIATLVLCSLLILLIDRYIVTKLLLPLKIFTVNFVQVFLGPAARFFTRTIKKMRVMIYEPRYEHTKFDYSDKSSYEHGRASA